MEKVPPFAEGFSQGALAPHLAKEYEFVGPYLVEKSGDWLGWARPHPRELAVGVVRGAVWCVLYDHENYKRGLRFLPDVTKCKAEKGNIFSITVRDGTKYEFQPAPTSEIRFDAWLEIINRKLEEARESTKEQPSASKKLKGDASAPGGTPGGGGGGTPQAAPATAGKRARDDTPGESPQPQSAPSPDAPPEVFISYHWGEKVQKSGGKKSACKAACECCQFLGQEKAKRVAAELKKKGLQVFLDYNAMVEHGAPGRQGVVLTMARNVQAAIAVVVCASEGYDKSANCVRELEYAVKFEGDPATGSAQTSPPYGKHVIFVNCGEPGWAIDPAKNELLSIYQGSKLWAHNQTADAWKTAAGFDTLWSTLKQIPAIKALRERRRRAGETT